MISKLHYITQDIHGFSHAELAKLACRGGVDWVQVRVKNKSYSEWMEIAEETKSVCLKYGAKFIINDNVQIANEISADGVHLGLSDMPVHEARKILGNKIIGGTANTLEDVLMRVEEKCDYVGLGPFRFTTTKENLSPVLGLEGYKKIMHELDKREISIPVFAIGGILADDVSAILETGVYGIAVSGLITNYTGKKELINQINNLLHAQTQNR